MSDSESKSNDEQIQAPELNEEEQPKPKLQEGVVPEEMASCKVICICSDGEIEIEAGKLQQSKIFSNWVGSSNFLLLVSEPLVLQIMASSK